MIVILEPVIARQRAGSLSVGVEELARKHSVIMVRSLDVISTVIVMAPLIGLLLACELDQAHKGCKIQGESCLCGFGCKTEYRFPTQQECRNALKKRGTNICSRLPCLNNGSCIQITQSPGYKCRCEGTGYYGNRCETACPTSLNGGVFPYECIVI